MINKFTDDDEVVKALHLLLLGGLGNKGQRKKFLRLFNGFGASVTVEQVETKLVDNKKKWKVELLKAVADIFGLEKGGNREELCHRIATYCMSPHETKAGDAVPAGSIASTTKKVVSTV
jgi:hypothetical protein